MARQGCVICSKDDHFHRIVAARRCPPKLLHLAMGNASNERILAALISAADAIDAALAERETGTVVVG